MSMAPVLLLPACGWLHSLQFFVRRNHTHIGGIVFGGLGKRHLSPSKQTVFGRPRPDALDFPHSISIKGFRHYTFIPSCLRIWWPSIAATRFQTFVALCAFAIRV